MVLLYTCLSWNVMLMHSLGFMEEGFRGWIILAEAV